MPTHLRPLRFLAFSVVLLFPVVAGAADSDDAEKEIVKLSNPLPHTYELKRESAK